MRRNSLEKSALVDLTTFFVVGNLDVVILNKFAVPIDLINNRTFLKVKVYQLLSVLVLEHETHLIVVQQQVLWL